MTYTLLVDGSSDRALAPIVDFTLWSIGVREPTQPQLVAPADIRRVAGAFGPLEERIKTALDLYPCDLLVVHRDAEREPLGVRRQEVLDALAVVQDLPRVVPVVPVRMHEAWLLIDSMALRRAAGNPYGSMPINLPPLQQLENLPDPKDELDSLLKRASGLTGYRLRKFDSNQARVRLVQHIQDFTPLENLPSYKQFKLDLIHELEHSGWI